jgi:hypothetical protein
MFMTIMNRHFIHAGHKDWSSSSSSSSSSSQCSISCIVFVFFIVLLLAAVMFLRIDTHQGGSRIPRLSILLFCFFFLVLLSVSYHLIHTIQIRTCMHIHRLSIVSFFFLSRYIYIMLINDEHLLFYEI